MLDYTLGFLVRSAVMIPSILLFCAALWRVGKKLGWLRLDQHFNPSDMRTWPLSYALADAGIFAVVFAAIAAALGDSQYAVAMGAGAASLIAIGVVPALAGGHRR